MQLLAQFMTVLILGGGAEPGITIVPEQILPPAQCKELEAEAKMREPILLDQTSGRPVIMTLHKCVILDGEMERDDWQHALDRY